MSLNSNIVIGRQSTTSVLVAAGYGVRIRLVTVTIGVPAPPPSLVVNGVVRSYGGDAALEDFLTTAHDAPTAGGQRR